MLKNSPSEMPLYRQIYKAVRRAILNGEFKPQAKLPASRTLAQHLGVSRITVINAYEQLYAEGYLEGKIGSGTFVATELPDDVLQIKRVEQKKKFTSGKSLPVDRFSSYGQRLVRINAHLTHQDETSNRPEPFASGLPAIDKFPFQIWSRIAARIYSNPPSETLGYSDPQGYSLLREAVATHLNSVRGVNCQPEQILITGGTQQALDLIIRLFLTENDGVLIENPCYLNARGVFGAAGAKLIPVPVDDNGFDVTSVPTDKNIKLIYVTPSHQYPLGVTMSLARRLALIEWAKNSNAVIVEDDYDSEFRYSGHPLASLQGLDSAGRVIYLGTFSKTTFPALRLGCLVIPSNLIDVFKLAHIFNRIECPLIDQMILAEFIAEGHFERHLRQMRKLYDERRKYLLAQCERHLRGLLEIQNADAGMHLVGWLPEKVNDKAISEAARKNNLKVAAISEHYIGNQSRSGLILGYTAFSEKQMESGVKILRRLCLQSPEFR